RSEPVDRQMDRAPRPVVGLAGAVAAQKLDLQMVERIEIGEALANAAFEGRVVLEQRLLARDGKRMAHGERVLVGDPAKNVLAQCLVGDKLGVSRSDR